LTTLEQIQTALTDLAAPYRDARIHHCRIKAAALVGGNCALAGTVLDAQTKAAVTSGLVARFPETGFDTDGVRVLRPGQKVTVATNVTGLHAEPSFQSEMASQLLNGWSVERLLEQERWVYVRQPDGYLGWAYHPYLTQMPAPEPTHIVCEAVSLLRDAPDATRPPVGRVLGGTAVHAADAVDAAPAPLGGPWVRLALAGNLQGWVPVAALRPLDALPDTAAARRRQMVQDAARFVGVPYLWGGCTAFGIDCSGLVQLLHRLAGLTLPRDADIQYAAGQPVVGAALARAEPPYQPGDLLFFGGESDRRSITHVGMSLGGWRMVHSSRARNGVYTDDVQAVEHLRERFVGARTFLR
jgi:cell wall-associated NlpC family hydrolase